MDATGKSSTAIIVAAQNQNTGQEVAIKCVSRLDGANKNTEESVAKEVALMRELHTGSGHPNVLGFVDYAVDPRTHYIVMELAPGACNARLT